jgi:hypothetical protein
MFQMTNDDVQHEVKATILERGQAALIAALGPAGATEFLRLNSGISPEAGDNELNSILISYRVDRELNEVVVEFNRPTTAIRFVSNDAMEFAKEIARRAAALIGLQA